MFYIVWKGKISFGLIDIFIKLYGVIEEKDVKLCMLYFVCYIFIY